MTRPSESNSNEIPSLSTDFLESVKQREPAAWARLVVVFGPIVYRWCRCSGVRQADVPDITQDVFATVARGIGDFQRRKEHGSFRSWLATITRSRIRDFRRRDLRHQCASGGSAAFERLRQIADSNQVSDDLDSSISEANIETSIAQRTMQIVRAEFEPTTWQAFWMTTMDDMTPAAVAQSLGQSLASVYQARSRVLRRLRQRLSELPQ